MKWIQFELYFRRLIKLKTINSSKKISGGQDNIKNSGHNKRADFFKNKDLLFQDISAIIDTLQKCEFFALCQSYCPNELKSPIDYNSLMNYSNDLEYCNNIAYYNLYIPYLRENGLKKLYDGMTKKEDFSINKSDQYETGITHSRFTELIDDYLAFDIEEEEKTAFEEHLLACDACSDVFFINKGIVNIIKTKGNELLIKILDNDDKTKLEAGPMPCSIFFNMCLKELFGTEEPVLPLEIVKKTQLDPSSKNREKILSKDIIEPIKKHGRNYNSKGRIDADNHNLANNHFLKKENDQNTPLKNEKRHKNLDKILPLIPFITIITTKMLLNFLLYSG